MITSRMIAGILAHVDAGKTTLSEAMLYESGVIGSLGRVDQKTAFLDTDSVEKERGITIYSKNARIPFKGGCNRNGQESAETAKELVLIDTPGHVDFSTEMERTLGVLDFAVLLISAPSGVQAHTKTVWKLLNKYHVPIIIFVNKMDMPGCEREAVYENLKESLSDSIVDFTGIDCTGGNSIDSLYEDIASNLSETALEEYLETGAVSDEHISEGIMKRGIFPCLFGSALRNEGVRELLDFIKRFLLCDAAAGYSGGVKTANISSAAASDFGAVVYKISRDNVGNRLTHMRINSGTLKVKEVLGDEKINEIRKYSGEKYESVKEITAPDVCAVVGMVESRQGMAFGTSRDMLPPVLEPVMSYKVKFADDVDTSQMLKMLKTIEEEDPSLKVMYLENIREIQVMLMGDVQTEILKRTMEDRFNTAIDFVEGRVCYKETVDARAEGVGHFEPLRHYAEAHILIEPLPTGSGIEIETDVSEDVLARNWQRLIVTHLAEKEHRGVMLGAPLTDVRYTLVAGKAHPKHTEGGDFRQATYRAVRQGLMELYSRGKCHLLEPYFDFTLELPEQLVGRAMTDISNMSGTCEIAENDIEEHISILTGRAPVSTLNGYVKEVAAYSKGLGHLDLRQGGYDKCHNEDEVMAASTYNPEGDLRNPCGSVFCSHGAGDIIPWNEVPEYMHVEYASVGADGEDIDEGEDTAGARGIFRAPAAANGGVYDVNGRRLSYEDMPIGTEEVDAIIRGTAHANANGRKEAYKGISASRRESMRAASKRVETAAPVYKGTPKKEKYYLIDGYNVIHAWQELRELAAVSYEGANNKLIDIMSNYQAMTGINVMVVFDAYRVKSHALEVKKYNNIYVVYTKEAQTADAYIERYVNENCKKYDITVITSDGLEQIIVRGSGCGLISSKEFEEEVNRQQKIYNETHGVESI